MHSKNKFCKNTSTQNINFRVVYTDLFKCTKCVAPCNKPTEDNCFNGRNIDKEDEKFFFFHRNRGFYMRL